LKLSAAGAADVDDVVELGTSGLSDTGLAHATIPDTASAVIAITARRRADRTMAIH
jgi:hypothetical protein